MQPAAADVEGDAGRRHDGVTASADTVARFQHDHREAGMLQRPRRAKARGTRADNGDIDFGGEGHEVVNFFRHARPCAGHPRLSFPVSKTWMGGARPAPTGFFCLWGALYPPPSLAVS